MTPQVFCPRLVRTNISLGMTLRDCTGTKTLALHMTNPNSIFGTAWLPKLCQGLLLRTGSGIAPEHHLIIMVWSNPTPQLSSSHPHCLTLELCKYLSLIGFSKEQSGWIHFLRSPSEDFRIWFDVGASWGNNIF